jgi:hypothetical protein
LSPAGLSFFGKAGVGRSVQECPVLTAPASKCNSVWSVIVLADGTRAAIVGDRRLRYVADFVQLSDKPLLASI